MSAIIWCDIHNGVFSERDYGWAFIEMSVRNPDDTTKRKTLHACKPCVDKLIVPPAMPALETTKKDGDNVSE